VDAVDALKHKIIYVPEAAAIADKHGVESPFTTMLRVLISEGRIVYQTVRTQENGPPITVTIVKNGPIAVFITSARDNVEEEMLTRLMVLDADESNAQTQAIIDNALTDRRHQVRTEEIEAWIDFQRWLKLGGPYEVAIPFLSAIKAPNNGEAHEAFDCDMASLYSANVPETAKAVVRAVEVMLEAEKARGEDVNHAKV